MDGFKSRLDLAEGRINEMEERAEEIFQNSYGETKKKRKIMKVKVKGITCKDQPRIS